MANLGDAKLTLRTDNTDFNKGINEANKGLDGFRKKAGLALTAAGAAITAFAVVSVNKFAEYADNIDKLADRTQLSTDLVQELALVLGRNGQSVEELDTVSKGLIKTLGQVQDGVGRGKDALDELGVSITENDLNAERLDDVFIRIVKSLQNVEQDTRRNVLATDIFAGGQKTLAVTLTNTNEQFDQIRSSAHEMGLVLENTGVKGGASLTDQMADLQMQMMMVQVRLGELISPFLIMFLDKTIEVTNAVSGFVQENRELTKFIGLSVVALGGFITAIGLGSLTFGAFTKAIAASRIAFALFNTVVLANPIGAVAFAITSLIAILVAVRLKTGNWSDTFKVLGETILNFAIQPINILLKTLNALGKGLGMINEDWGFTIELIEVDFTTSLEKAADATHEFRERAKYNFDITKDAFISMYDGMERSAKSSEEVLTKTATEEAANRVIEVNNAIVKAQELISGVDAGLAIRQTTGAMNAATQPDSGRQQMFEDLARSDGRLQVSTGERDASGGVIFRDANQDDFNRIFKDDIEAKLPTLLGVTPFNASSELAFFGMGQGQRVTEGGTNINITVDGKNLESAILDVGQEQGGID